LSPAAIIFVVAALLTALVSMLLVSRMAKQLKQAAPPRRRASLFLDLHRILREHYRLFPQSGAMLAFWLSVIFLLVWLTCIVFSLSAYL
jgi:hypothetical protein